MADPVTTAAAIGGAIALPAIEARKQRKATNARIKEQNETDRLMEETRKKKERQRRNRSSQIAAATLAGGRSRSTAAGSSAVQRKNVLGQ